MKRTIEGVGEVAVPRTFKEKLSNFWYHYKWHSIISVFVVIALVICSLQFCTKTDYDMHILYAGGKTVSRTVSSETGEAEIETLLSSLGRVADDCDGDGEVRLTLGSYYYLSSAEIAKKEADGEEISYTLLNEDADALESVLGHSEYYLCFISSAVYETYRGEDGGNFISLSRYKEIDPSVEFYAGSGECAILLSSLTDFYSLPGICDLPEDTLICIRSIGYLSRNDKKHKEHQANAISALENIVKFSFG